MNTDQIKGTIMDAAGRVQHAAGKMLGSTDQQLRGTRKQVEARAQKAAGDIREIVKQRPPQMDDSQIRVRR
jgi:uncharacterized protein YjbJ (UPF0337 family)